MTRVFEGERTFLSPVLRPVEAAIYRIAGVDETPRAALDDLYGRHAALPRRRVSPSLRAACALQACCRSIRRSSRRSRRTCRSTPRSASSPTPTGRTTAARARCAISCRWLGLTHQNFLSAATGIVLAVALIRGFARALGAAPSAISGSISRAARSTSCCRSAIVVRAVPGLAGHAANARRLCRRDDARRRQADHRSQGPVASQIAIKMLGTNGGGFFNANCRASVREPDGAVELRRR